MTAPSWVLDTNVVVSGLLVAHGFSGRLLDAVIGGALRITYDDRIEAEYREVLSRPRFTISPTRLEPFLDLLRIQNSVTTSPWKGHLSPDPDDQPFLEVALHATDQILVTGNAKHFPASCRGTIKVLTPREAWSRLVGQS